MRFRTATKCCWCLRLRGERSRPGSRIQEQLRSYHARDLFGRLFPVWRTNLANVTCTQAFREGRVRWLMWSQYAPFWPVSKFI